jgi:hypothetical protein
MLVTISNAERGHQAWRLALKGPRAKLGEWHMPKDDSLPTCSEESIVRLLGRYAHWKEHGQQRNQQRQRDVTPLIGCQTRGSCLGNTKRKGWTWFGTNSAWDSRLDWTRSSHPLQHDTRSTLLEWCLRPSFHRLGVQMNPLLCNTTNHIMPYMACQISLGCDTMLLRFPKRNREIGGIGLGSLQ